MMPRRVRFAEGATAAGALMLVAALTPLFASAQRPAAAPPAAPIRAAQFPPTREATLANGMRLVVVQSNKQPVVAVSLTFAAGAAYDPPAKAGLADMMATLLTRGAGARTAEEFSAAIENVGGQLTASASADVVTLRADALTDAAPLAFSLLADAARRPTFPDKEVELLRTQLLSALTVELSQPTSLAERTFVRGVFGEHPYARRADPTSVRSMTRADLVAFHDARLRPAGALLVVAGSLSFEQAKKLAEQAFGSWTGAAASPLPRTAIPVRSAREIVLVHRPGSVQSNILVGNATWRPNDPRAYAAAIANRLLGGGADSRLFLTLREKKSWTYSARSSIASRREMGSFEAATEVRNSVTDSALVELLAQIDRLGTEPLDRAEFDRTRNAMTGAFPLSIETAGQVAAEIANAKLLGLPADFVQSYRQKLAAVTPEQVQRAARDGMRSSSLFIVVVGDALKVRAQLEKIAPVRIVSVDGTPLRPEDLVVKAAALDLDLTHLVPRTDSFSILVQGRPLGYQRTTLARTAAGWELQDVTRLATVVQQNTTVRFSSALVMQSVSQSGKAQGQDTKIEVTYANGHATGTAVAPQQGAIKTVNVDTDLPAGAVDDNLIATLLPTFRWASGARFVLPVFQSGKGTATALTISVVAEESVTVIAGTFAAWKADITGGDSPISVWVEKGGAHRLLKLAMTGQPVEFQLVK